MSNEKEKPLKQLVDKMLRSYGLGDKLDEMSLVKSWEELVGKMIANHTQEIYFNKGVLFVRLDSSTLRQELSYVKSDLIQRLNEKAGKVMVKDIHLK
ncbi:MAG: putative nucleic acid-binding Zn ribbon protein [Vicingaceae bacterium]|jgi:predicted nucleic acid-binding Zn ribbon protein